MHSIKRSEVCQTGHSFDLQQPLYSIGTLNRDHHLRFMLEMRLGHAMLLHPCQDFVAG